MDSEAFARFTHEAKILGNLTHPQIACLWDLGKDDGRYYIALRYVEGKSLDKVIAERVKAKNRCRLGRTAARLGNVKGQLKLPGVAPSAPLVSARRPKIQKGTGYATHRRRRWR